METGLIFALLTAVSFAASTIFLRRGVSQAGESFTAVVISVQIGALIFLLMMVFTAEWDKVWSLSWQGLVLLAGAGVLQFVFGRFLFANAVRLIGANKTSPLTRTNIFFAVVLGIIFLKETLTITTALGILCIAGGAIMVSSEKGSVSAIKQREPSGMQINGVLSALGAGLVWGISGVMIRPAIVEIGSPAAGAFVSFATAALILAGLLLRKEQRELLTHLRRSSVFFLAINGVLVTLSHFFRYTALSYSPVSLVTPMVSTSILFLLLFSFLLNRKLEVFTWRVMAGMVTTVAGVVIIAV